MGLLSIFKTFVKGETGAMTAYGLVSLTVMLGFGGLAIDVGNAYRIRTHLQVTSDSVAHAALYSREWNTAETAIQDALDVAHTALPVSLYGDAIKAEDIEFGIWDPETLTFTVDPNAKNAVRVNSNREAARNNSAVTYMLGLFGVDRWDVRRSAVFETYVPTCLREGFVADNIVDIQSNNGFYNGFCIHANQWVEVNQNNYFEENTIVSMPDKTQLVLPNSGFESNEGLQSALRDGVYRMRILNRLPQIIDALEDPSSDYAPDYITNNVVQTLSSRNVGVGDMVAGNIYTYTCSGGQGLNFANDVMLFEVVLVTNCKVSFSSGTVLDNAIVATTNTDVKSITGPSGVQIGRDDECAVDGGAQVLTLGGVEFPANLQVFGGQIIAMKNIEFAANANGIEGASFISGATISGTSNMTMGFCGTGMEDNFEALYFRLAA